MFSNPFHLFEAPLLRMLTLPIYWSVKNPLCCLTPYAPLSVAETHIVAHPSLMSIKRKGILYSIYNTSEYSQHVLAALVTRKKLDNALFYNEKKRKIIRMSTRWVTNVRLK